MLNSGSNLSASYIFSKIFFLNLKKRFKNFHLFSKILRATHRVNKTQNHINTLIKKLYLSYNIYFSLEKEAIELIRARWTKNKDKEDELLGFLRGF